MDKKNGVKLNKRTDDVCLSLVGEIQTLSKWNEKLISKLELVSINIGQNDKVHFYANEKYNICLRFIEEWDDDKLLLKLTCVYAFPIFYEKSKDELNNEAINHAAFGIAIVKEIDSLTKTGKGISDDEYTNCQIEAYKRLRNEGRLK